MKSLFLAMVLVFGLFLQVNDAEAKRYRAIKSKKAYTYNKPVRPVRKAEPVRQAEKPKTQETQQVQQPQQQQYQDNSLRNTVVGAATGAVVGAATGAVVGHMLNSDEPAAAAETAKCDPIEQDCPATQATPAQEVATPAQDAQVDAISQDEKANEPVAFDWMHAILALGLGGAIVAFLRQKRHS